MATVTIPVGLALGHHHNRQSRRALPLCPTSSTLHPVTAYSASGLVKEAGASLEEIRVKRSFGILKSNDNTNTHITTGTQVFAISGKTSQDAMPSLSATMPSGWIEFAKIASGEWDGFGADFGKDGIPIELPETVVPEAYREWEVKVFDWQTQCPTLALPEQISLNYQVIKLLPTVGCEADAATRYSIDERIIDLPSLQDKKVSALAYQSGGCYVAIWPLQDHDTHKIIEVEHCLVDPRDKESRVRLVQVLHQEKHKLELQSIKVFCEQWYGPFRNGDQLGGCAIRDSAFASTPALQSSEVVGTWQGLNAVASFQNSPTNAIKELVEDSVQTLVRDEQDLRLLPKQLWCSLAGSEDGDTCCEAGWLLNQDRAITSRCIFSSNAELKEVRVACETRAL